MTEPDPDEDVVRLPIEGELDLHAFGHEDIVSVVQEFVEACRQKGVLELRIVHGRGTGARRAQVHRLLRSLPGVRSFRDAPPSSGGWGATLVVLES